MMRLVSAWLAGGLLLGVLAGCDSGGSNVTEPQTAQFQASVQGSVTNAYQGEGLFKVVSAPTLPGLQIPAGVSLPSTFVLFSASPDAAAAEVQSFALVRIGNTIPSPGTYSLDLLSSVMGGFHAMYGRATATEREEFMATSGSVRITSATADRVEGTFQFHGVRLCGMTAGQVACTVPTGLLGVTGAAAAPTIDVSGSFGARQAPQTVPAPFGL